MVKTSWKKYWFSRIVLQADPSFIGSSESSAGWARATCCWQIGPDRWCQTHHSWQQYQVAQHARVCYKVPCHVKRWGVRRSTHLSNSGYYFSFCPLWDHLFVVKQAICRNLHTLSHHPSLVTYFVIIFTGYVSTLIPTQTVFSFRFGLVCWMWPTLQHLNMTLTQALPSFERLHY